MNKTLVSNLLAVAIFAIAKHLVSVTLSAEQVAPVQVVNNYYLAQHCAKDDPLEFLRSMEATRQQ